jgi:hypothetical protein
MFSPDTSSRHGGTAEIFIVHTLILLSNPFKFEFPTACLGEAEIYPAPADAACGAGQCEMNSNLLVFNFTGEYHGLM